MPIVHIVMDVEVRHSTGFWHDEFDVVHVTRLNDMITLCGMQTGRLIVHNNIQVKGHHPGPPNCIECLATT